ncbi:hypothetical protein [Streptomyces liangshanensis]|uniref:hypothetical protein n=1 Tax=Streptomyces liangshanensis TaxID=2717324 RepID=UPI0036DD9C19
MHDEQPGQGGGVPNAFRNAIFWRWSRTMPRPLRGAFLTLLYALGSAANPGGALRFRDGTVIRAQDIARAVGSDQKDVRRYLTAAIAAGVVAVQGARGRGRRPTYIILVTPSPDWTAAVASLALTRPKKKPAPWTEPEFGGPTPEPASPPSSGDQPPNPTGSSSGDRPPFGFGGPTPEQFGGRSPEQPMITQELPQVTADVGGDQRDAREPLIDEPPPTAEPPPPSTTPPLRGVPTPPGARATALARGQRSSNQAPLLLPVRTPPHVGADRAQLRAAATPDAIRRAIADLGTTTAIDLYGWRLTAPHLPDTDTGT